MATPRVVETLNVPHVPLDTSLSHLPALSDHRRMNASASPAPVTALTPEKGTLPPLHVRAHVAVVTSFLPISPLPPMTTIFMTHLS